MANTRGSGHRCSKGAGTSARPAHWRVAVAGTIALLTAFGSSHAISATPPADRARAAAAFPVRIQDCGRTVTFRSAPRRVVILAAPLADAMIELGLGNRIVAQSGTGLAKPLIRNKARMARVPTLSPGILTSTEAILGTKPDLVYTDLQYRLDPDQAGASAAQIRASGAQTYISAGGCKNSAGNGKVADVFTEIANLGKIFGVQSKAAALVKRLRARLTVANRRIAGQPKVRVFEFLSVAGAYVSAGGVQMDSIIRSGGTTIFPGVTTMANARVSPEAVAARNPQVIIELTRGPIDPRKKRAHLKKAFPTTEAVKKGRLYFLDAYAAGSAGAPLRTVDGVFVRAKQLHPNAF